jgi:hypothetical protein
MTMHTFKFRYPQWVDVQPSVWVQKWNDLFLLGKERKADDDVYKTLMEKKGQLSGQDFEQIGRWKVGCLLKEDGVEHGMWKPQTSTAYDVWMQAKQSPPQHPESDVIDELFAERFLEEWSERKFDMPVKGGEVKGKRFGLSYATALLHFMSVGRFPIYDAGVRYGLKRLGLRLPSDMSVNAYLTKFCPMFSSLAAQCGLQSVDDLRTLDNALRCYGGDDFPLDRIAVPSHGSSDRNLPSSNSTEKL